MIGLDELLTHLQNLVLRISDIAKGGEKRSTLCVRWKESDRRLRRD